MSCCSKCNQPIEEDACGCRCPDITNSGELVVMDGNCAPKRLSGNGLPFAQDGQVHLTDGSERSGIITLNPPITPSAAALVILDANGNVLKLSQFNDGDVFAARGGQLVFVPAQEAKNTYRDSDLRSGAGPLAAFICGEGGSVQLGKFDGCKDGYLSFDINGTPVCLTIAQLTELVKEQICASSALKEASDTLTGALVCTNNGIKKSLQTDRMMVHQSPWHRICYVPVPFSSPAALHTFDITTLPGYLEKYGTVWLRTRLLVGSGGADYRIVVNMGPQELHSGIVRAHVNTLSVDFINPTYVFPYPVSAGPLNIISYIALLSGSTNNVYEMEYELNLVGWSV